ncbi:ABC transporter permease [Weissella paramesenteroides]|uniref:ABC transporter permease n=1 Tax=Weissella paramesenteroides TaxID=1249 RepID=UPI0024027783|nr:ABC transporter permease [Weissella paramesenteroides]MDF8367831.1 ABC transporter permease [Weissella paramesenteroides]
MRTLAMIKRVLQEMLRDKRTLAMMFTAPLLILTLMYFLFQSNNNQTADLAVRNVDSTLIKAIDNNNLKIHHISSDDSAKQLIRDHDYAAVMTQKGNKLTLTLQNSNQTKSSIIKKSLQSGQIKLKTQASVTALKTQKEAIQKLQQQLAVLAKQTGTQANVQASLPKQQNTTTKNYSVSTHYIYGDKDTNFFDTFLPVMMGFVVFFFVFLISGIALLRERTTGTLKRLLATPVKRGEIITGYLSGYGIFALIQTLLIVFYSTYVFDIQILGSIWNVLLINVLMAMVALTMGLFISTFAASEFQMMQFIPIIVIPQVFFSGIIPVDQMAGWLQVIGHIMPLYYGANAMSDVVAKGFSITQIWPNLLALLLFATLFLALNLNAMRRYREV